MPKKYPCLRFLHCWSAKCGMQRPRRRDKLNPAGVRKDNPHPTRKLGGGAKRPLSDEGVVFKGCAGYRMSGWSTFAILVSVSAS